MESQSVMKPSPTAEETRQVPKSDEGKDKPLAEAQIKPEPDLPASEEGYMVKGTWYPYQGSKIGFWSNYDGSWHWYPQGSKCADYGGWLVPAGLSSTEGKLAADSGNLGPDWEFTMDSDEEPRLSDVDSDTDEETPPKAKRSKKEVAVDSGAEAQASAVTCSSRSRASRRSKALPLLAPLDKENEFSALVREQQKILPPAPRIDGEAWQKFVAHALGISQWNDNWPRKIVAIHPSRIQSVDLVDLVNGIAKVTILVDSEDWDVGISKPVQPQGATRREGVPVPLVFVHSFAEDVVKWFDHHGRLSMNKASPFPSAHGYDQVAVTKRVCASTRLCLVRKNGQLRTCSAEAVQIANPERYQYYRAMVSVANVMLMPEPYIDAAAILAALEKSEPRSRAAALFMRALFPRFTGSAPLSAEERKQAEAWAASSEHACRCSKGQPLRSEVVAGPDTTDPGTRSLSLESELVSGGHKRKRPRKRKHEDLEPQNQSQEMSTAGSVTMSGDVVDPLCSGLETKEAAEGKKHEVVPRPSVAPESAALTAPVSGGRGRGRSGSGWRGNRGGYSRGGGRGGLDPRSYQGSANASRGRGRGFYAGQSTRGSGRGFRGNFRGRGTGQLPIDIPRDPHDRWGLEEDPLPEYACSDTADASYTPTSSKKTARGTQR